MKRVLIFPGILMMIVQGLSGQEIFRTTHDNNFVDLSQAIIQTTDGGYVVAGQTYASDAGRMTGLVIKYDAGCKMAWKKEIGREGDRWLEIYDAAETVDRDLLLTGRAQSDVNNSYDLYLCKFSQHGDLIWERNYGGQRGETGYKVIPVSGNGIMVAGTTCSDDGDREKMLVTRFDNAGNLIWTKSFGDNESEEAFSIMELKNSKGFLLIGTLNSGKGRIKNLSLIRLDGVGNTVWHRVVESSHVQVGFNSVEDENGNIMVTGISKKVNKCRNNLMLTQVSAEGMILWTKEVAMDGCVGKTSLALSGMEGFYVGGTLFNFKKDVSSIFIIKISPKGKTEWTRMVGGGFQETCKAMIINAEKELVIAGEITGDNMNTDILLVKATGKTP